MLAKPAVKLSVVVPIFNEAASLPELVSRCRAAAAQAAADFELLFIDDASTDQTGRLAEVYEDSPRVQFLRLSRNLGQFGATQQGLRASRGELVAVLDGDLQDPPETIPKLVEALLVSDETDAVFAAKIARGEPPLFLLGQAAFHLIQSSFSAPPVPRGVGSFCLMRRQWAERLSKLTPHGANISAALIALGARSRQIPYSKDSRRDGRSRIGSWGLAREAVASLIISGALSRLSCASAIAALLIGATALRRHHLPALISFGSCLFFLAAALVSSKRRGAWLKT